MIQEQPSAWSAIGLFVALIGCLLIAGLSGWLHYDAIRLAESATYAIVAVAVVYFAYLFAFSGLTRSERGRLIVIFVLISAATVFWVGSEQAGSSLNLFAQRYTIREFGGFVLPASWFQ